MTHLVELISEWRDAIVRLATENPTQWADADLPNVLADEYWSSRGRVNQNEIRAKELQLGASLPDEYRDFVTSFNGWPLPGFGYDGAFLPLADVGLYRNLEPAAFKNLPKNINGPVRFLAEANFSTSFAADQDWLHDSILLTSDNFNNSTMVLMVPLAANGRGWIEYWYESSRDGVWRFHHFLELLHHLRDRLLRALPYQMGIS